MRTLILSVSDQALTEGSINNEGPFTDGRVSVAVARGLHAKLDDPAIDIIETTPEGMDFLGIVVGYHKVVVVDCVNGNDCEIGELRRLGLEHLELAARQLDDNETEYRATVPMPETGGAAVPHEISIYAIEVGGADSAAVAGGERAREAVPRLIDQIAREEFGARVPADERL